MSFDRKKMTYIDSNYKKGLRLTDSAFNLY